MKRTNNVKNIIATKTISAFSLNLGKDWYHEGQLVDLEDTMHGQLKNALITFVDEDHSVIMVYSNEKIYKIILESLINIQMVERRSKNSII